MPARRVERPLDRGLRARRRFAFGSARCRWQAAAFALMGLGLLRALAFNLSTGGEPWFDPRLEIDARSYLAGMESIARSGDPLRLEDLYHSPGYQLYLALLRSLAGSTDAAIRAVKLVAWGFHALTVPLAVFIGARLAGPAAGLLGGVFVAFSHSLASYAALVQYEAPLAFLVAAHTAGLAAAPGVRSASRRAALGASLGLVGSAAVLVQDRFAPLLAVGAFALWRADRASRRAALAYVAPALLLVGGWSAFQTARLGAPVLVSAGSEFRFAAHNNPNSIGEPYPYVPRVEPSGLRFVLERPASYLRLAAERFLYTWNLKKDVWHLDLPWLGPSAAAWFHTLAFIAFWLGFGGKLVEDFRERRLGETAPAYLTVAVGLLGPLLVVGAARYNVPLFSLVAAFQAAAIVGLARRLTAGAG